MCGARIWRRCGRSPGRPGAVRSISTLPTGTRMHLLADTSVPATAGNTALRAWRNISRLRPFSDFTDDTATSLERTDRNQVPHGGGPFAQIARDWIRPW